MDVILTYDREDMEGLNSAQVMELINKHINEVVPEYEENMAYYLGQHEILDSVRPTEDAPNAQPVCNHAKDIADTASGYFMGNPISYRLVGYDEDSKEREAFSELLDYLDYATTSDDDQENALMLSICGKTYEYIYAAEDEA